MNYNYLQFINYLHLDVDTANTNNEYQNRE